LNVQIDLKWYPSGQKAAFMPSPEKKPTLKDVARLAGVSYQTVSFVVNNVPVVTEATRQRVVAAIEQLHYTPDPAARSLRLGQTHIIGLMIPDAHNPHFWQTVSGAEEEALANGYSLLLATTSMNKDREELAFQALLKQHLDAIIPLFTYPENFTRALLSLQRRHIPFAISASGAKLPDVAMDVVYARFEQAARQLMDHLLDLGHRRIAMICGVGRSGLGNDRIEAYRAALDNAGIPRDLRLEVICGNTLTDGYHAAETLLDIDSPPTAIIGINDVLAFGAMQAVLRRGLRVPEEISIAGFDDLPLSSLIYPALTTGRVDGAEIGRQCVRLVLERLANPDLPPREINIPTHLVVRESTGPVPSGDFI
jgi:DNA-binding LacI/PurR family transcriptional regulator